MRLHPDTIWSRPECPDVTEWSVPEQGATEREVTALVASFVVALRPRVVVETGTFRGDTAEAIGHALVANGIGHLWSLELDGDRFGAARDRLQGLPIDVVEIHSLLWLPPHPIDLLFIDTEYVDGTRAHEIRYFKQWASPRCVILTHDTVDGLYRDQLGPLVPETVQSWVHLPTPYGLSLSRYTQA